MRNRDRSSRVYRAISPTRLGTALALALALALVTVGACGDSAAGDPDAGSDAEVVCGPVAPESGLHGRLVVATEQYGSGGGISVIDLDTLEPSINVALAHDDVTVRWFDGRIWVLNRFGADNIMILDGSNYQLIKQFSVRPGPNQLCNPHDLVFLDRCRVYLSCFEQASVYVLDPTAPLGDEIVGSIDLSSLADDDGLPESSHMALVDGLVYVAVERLDRSTGWTVAPPSYVAVLDPTTDTLVDTIDLAEPNPVGPLVPVPGTADLIVAAGGDWSGGAAGILRIDTAARTSALAVSAAELGGLVASFTLGDDGCGHAVIMAPGSFETGVVGFCLDGTVEACLPVGDQQYTAVVQVDDGRLAITTTAYTTPGVRFFDPDGCTELTTAPIPTGFTPGFTDPLLLIPPD
jgi:hypothetical protein